jgi:hypothetical protein
MGRVLCGLFVFLGVLAVLRNRRAPDMAMRRSREQFGIEIKPGTRHHRFMTIFARTLNVVVGCTFVVVGFLGMFGVLPPPWP